MNEQLIVSSAAVVVALCALGVSIWQVRQGIKHKKLSVKPTITSWTETKPEAGYYCIWVVNNGLGPAIIEKFTVKVDDVLIPGVAQEPLEKGVAELFRNTKYDLQTSFMA